MPSTPKTGLGSIHLSRQTLCGTASPQVNTPSEAGRTSWVFFAANTKRFQTPRKQSSIYLLKAKKSPCGTISAEPNTVRWVRIGLPGRP